MAKVFIYYSLTGNGDLIAEKMKEKGYEIRKVVEKKRPPKSFFLLMMVGGFKAAIKAKSKLIDFDNDLSKFDEVVIGSPIWNGSFPPAINSVLALTQFEGKKLSFILYSGSGKGEKAERRIKSEYPGASFSFFQEPKKYKENLENL
ncbi:MAG: NAD(P)H-dependent oxidoreductase [Bacilli bacterium]|nr:NAD(P)H-dependent oxidoreductase [Bacilli bacterium]